MTFFLFHIRTRDREENRPTCRSFVMSGAVSSKRLNRFFRLILFVRFDGCRMNEGQLTSRREDLRFDGWSDDSKQCIGLTQWFRTCLVIKRLWVWIPLRAWGLISISVFSVLRQASRGDARLLSFSKKIIRPACVLTKNGLKQNKAVVVVKTIAAHSRV